MVGVFPTVNPIPPTLDPLIRQSSLSSRALLLVARHLALVELLVYSLVLEALPRHSQLPSIHLSARHPYSARSIRLTPVYLRSAYVASTCCAALLFFLDFCALDKMRLMFLL